MKKALPVAGLLLLMLLGVGLVARPDLVAMPGVNAPNTAVIIHESGVNKPLSFAMVEVLAKAPSLGINVWDQGILGKNKQPSKEAQPFLEAAKGKDLPVLVLRWPGGSYTVKPCPTTLVDLKKEVGQ
jgi:hypothetical protein